MAGGNPCLSEGQLAALSACPRARAHLLTSETSPSHCRCHFKVTQWLNQGQHLPPHLPQMLASERRNKKERPLIAQKHPSIQLVPAQGAAPTPAGVTSPRGPNIWCHLSSIVSPVPIMSPGLKLLFWRTQTQQAVHATGYLTAGTPQFYN